jgi:hypothetical protein
MLSKPGFLLLTGLLALAVVAIGGGTAAEAGTGSMTAMSLDTDIAGNSATAIGTVQECAEVDPGNTIVLDLVADGIPASNPMIAWGALVSLNGTALQITALDDQIMIGADPDSTEGPASEPVPGPPDSDFSMAAFDTSGAVGAETGDGVLARMTIEVQAGAADGVYDLFLGAAGHTDPNAVTWEPDGLGNARLAVGTATCATGTLQGDVDCNNSVTAVDSLKVLRSNASLPVVQVGPEPDPCQDIGTGTPIMGDVDCSGGVNAVDALKILRHNAGLSVSQTEPCPDIGTF